MRIGRLLVALALALGGCAGPTAGERPVESGSASAPATTVPVLRWQVIPIAGDMKAILLNAETGETWYFSSAQWNPAKRY